MKKINVRNAEGYELCHDITQILPGEFKGAKFLRGHIIRKEDIEVLISLGKENIFVMEEEDKEKNLIHENDAAMFIVEKLNLDKEFFEISSIREGKINITAKEDGILKIDINTLNKINKIGEIILVTKYNNSYIKKGENVAATRVIPLLIEKKQLDEMEKLVKEKNVLTFKKIDKNKKLALITTGNEVYNGIIKDKSKEALLKKYKKYKINDIEQVFSQDDKDTIKKYIKMFENEKDIIMCTGGMSIDPDDVTPSAIRESNWEIVTYGTPVLPGAMFMLAYKGEKVLIGLPGGVVFSEKTVFDVLLPRILANDRITKQEIIEMGHGGLLG
ncbi:molybdopterin-binding protein [Leptotrichia sp. oral taxon 212]|jgi:molybdopterin binding domain protein|uniref:molybdopterin-binding protein n=1 Tax=Leptotrichia sp. oral taxon 212 TaxID=712357 RepID=UPI0006A9E893|nr:molybdopterin-binding protein [Leptotrichia sp. oral taxon 212]ALA95431.1 molybdenum cofactor biosynthesis protein MoaB [Leptotrichia sp. oral taxon 212]